jgi:hypothetical protein
MYSTYTKIQYTTILAHGQHMTRRTSSFARARDHTATARVAMHYTTAAYVVSMRNEQVDGGKYIPNEELPPSCVRASTKTGNK